MMACTECGSRVRASQHHPITSCLRRLQRDNAALQAVATAARRLSEPRITGPFAVDMKALRIALEALPAPFTSVDKEKP